jgi:transposase-like protein
MAEKRRNYGDAFKREVVRLVTAQGYGVSETARNLGSSASPVLGNWAIMRHAAFADGADRASHAHSSAASGVLIV